MVAALAGSAATRTHASRLMALEGFSDAALAICTVPVVPLNPAAVLASPTIAPGRPSVTPPTYVPGFTPVSSAAPAPLSPNLQ